jgi:L-lactate dehydrogenase (cytochrome)
VFCGRAFLLGLAALGDSGGDYIAALLTVVLRAAMAQQGAHSIAELRAATVRHQAAWTFAKTAPVPLREASSRS